MNLKNIVLLIVCFSLLSFTMLQISSNQSDQYDDVGTVKYSILKPDLFQRTQRGKWVLLDGRDLSNSTELFRLLTNGNSTNILRDGRFLPDARGKFIRSSNFGGGNDPDVNRVVGSVQLDAFQGHKHIGDNKIAQNWSEQSPNNPHQRWNVTGNNLVETAGTFDAGYGVPRLSTETRPINLSFYTYIKISL
jgi:hypothetical protein